MKQILIIEDDPRIAGLERDYLEAAGLQASVAADGPSGLRTALDGRFDLILLDIMLPGMDGLEVCRSIRREQNVPIILVSAKKEDLDKIKGLGVGADDYVVKPFSPGEVMARIRAVLRRIPAATEREMLVIGELSIHLPSLSVTLSGHKLNLTRREVELLYTLAASPGRVFTRDNLLTIVWGYEFAGNYRAVDSHIKRLRAKLDAYPHDTFTIATVWGAGYKFERNLP